MNTLHKGKTTGSPVADAPARLGGRQPATGETDARTVVRESDGLAKGKSMRFVIYASANAAWYWELRDEQGTPLARSITGFSMKRLAMQNARAVRLGVTRACLYDPLGTLLIERGL